MGVDIRGFFFVTFLDTDGFEVDPDVHLLEWSKK
jgi:hypothetical protein